MDDAPPTEMVRLDWDAEDGAEDDGEASLLDEDNFDPEEWKQLQSFELPESIRQLFAEAGLLDAMPEGSAGPGDEVPMPWDSSFYGPLVDDRRPQRLVEVDGEPAYIEPEDEEGPWDTRRMEQQRAAELRKQQRAWWGRVPCVLAATPSHRGCQRRCPDSHNTRRAQ